MRLYSRQRIAFTVCLAACAAMLGCATGNYGSRITQVEYYPNCYAPMQDLRAADSNFNRTVGVSTTAGALLGAVLGYLASDSRHKSRGVLAGAAAGGALGAGVGYAKAKQDRIADDNQRMASYLRDIDGDISGLDRATAAARVARDCYNKEFTAAIAAYKAGRIGRPELQRRYDEIRNGCAEASVILGTFIDSTANKEQEYRNAIADEAQRAGKPVPVVAAGRSDADRKSSAKSRPRTPAKAASAPKQGDTSLEAVARSAQKLDESKQSAKDEQEELKKMQEEMDGTLATVMA